VTDEEAIAALDAIQPSGVDGIDHHDADEILLQVVGSAVVDAYRRVQARSEVWWFT
jgi:hypothetical protein